MTQQQTQLIFNLKTKVEHDLLELENQLTDVKRRYGTAIVELRSRVDALENVRK